MKGTQSTTFLLSFIFSATTHAACLEKDDISRLACYEKNRIFSTATHATCVKKDEMLRLACYDRKSGFKSDNAEQGQGKSDATPPSWMENLQVRDQGLPKMAAVAGPAVFGLVRENGKESSLAKASIIYSGSPFSPKGSGWYPFTSISIDRNLAASTPRSQWSILVGSRGTILDYTQQGFAFDTKVSLARKVDTQSKTESNQLQVDNQIVISGLATGEPWTTQGTTFQLIPTIGINYDNQERVKSGSVAGNYLSTYGGLSLVVWPSVVSDRVQLSAQTRRFVDIDVSGNIAKRYANHYSASIDYYLYDPREKVVFTPILGLSREVGSEPISGTLKSNITMLTLKFKVN